VDFLFTDKEKVRSPNHLCCSRGGAATKRVGGDGRVFATSAKLIHLGLKSFDVHQKALTRDCGKKEDRAVSLL